MRVNTDIDSYGRFLGLITDNPLFLIAIMSVFSGSKQTVKTLTTRGEFNIDNKLQVLLTLMSFLTAVVHLYSAFYNATGGKL